MERPLYTNPLRLGGILALLAATAACASAAPIISEFLADNQSFNRDEDGEFSDWLEIYNPDPDPVDLAGYFLTDNPTNLDKWEIPAGTVVAPGEFLLIFASGKDRKTAGEQLHTNFKIDDSGEYLALVDPTLQPVSEFAPTFPMQFDDASYGFEQVPVTFADVLADVDEAVTFLVPASSNDAPGTLWTELDFDDSQWEGGNLPLGYDRGDGYESLIDLDVEQHSYNANPSILIRIPFEAADLDDVIGLTLEMQFDDGFAAYLNGGLVATSNSPAIPTWNSSAASKRTDAEALDPVSFSLGSQLNRLEEGTNILSIHLMNASANDENLLLRPQLFVTRLESLTIGEIAFFTTPTPGSRNGVEEQLPASEVIISEKSRTFVDPFEVTLSSGFEGETIHYTLDGEEPTADSPEYSGPISIGRSTQLRARVIGENNEVGRIAMESYIHLRSDLRDFSSNLPIVILDTWGGGDPGGTVRKDAFWAIIEPNDDTGRAHISDKFQLATRAGIKRRGSSSFGWPKYSMTVEAQNEEGLDRGVRPLGLPRESDWILSGRYQFDLALMRNPLMYELSRQTGEYAVRTRFVEVFNNVGGGSLAYGGDYFGVYTFMEKIKRDDDRVDVARLDRRDNREPEVTGGYVFKKDRLDPGDSGFSVTTMGTLGWVEPKEREVTRAQKDWLVSHLNELSAALARPDKTNPTTGKHFTEYIDQFSWLRHHWLNTLAMNVDGFRLSGYYYKHRIDTNGGRVGAGPIWDFDRTMGSTDGRDDNFARWDGTGDSSMTWTDGRYPWWGQALADPDFRQAHIDLWQELSKTTFDIRNIYAVIDDFAAQLDPPEGDPDGVNPGLERTPAARNFEKWGRGRVHRNEVTILKNWLRGRVRWIDGQFTAQPEFETSSGFVGPGMINPGDEFSLSGGARVYYTTDGTDPRAPGGDPSPTAMLASGGIPLNETTVVTARAYDPSTPDPLAQQTRTDPITQWSGPVRGVFLLGPIATANNLAITEVHYAPLAPTSAEETAVSSDPSDFEFLELRNTSATDTINLTEVHFVEGIEFNFTGSAVTALAPGERVLVVRNKAAFEARYGTTHSDRIAGEFSPDRLDNAGERIHLVDGNGNTIAEFRYNDKTPWPADAGITGYSLVLNSFAEIAPDYSNPAHWRSSSALGGNPNDSDSLPITGELTEDNDRDGLQRILEHALGTSDDDPTDLADAFSASVQLIEVDNVTKPYLTITFQRVLSADDVELVPEISVDYLDWAGGNTNVVKVSATNQGDGTALVTYRAATPVDPEVHPKEFVRLKATKPLPEEP